MSSDSNYNYSGSEEFIIENGVLRGKKRTYITGHNNFGESLLENLRANPNVIGEIDGLTGREIKFSEMMEKSVKCAMWLKEENIGIGDIVGICTHNQVDMYVPCFASLYIGAVYNPWWDSGISREWTKHFLDFTKPKVLFVNEVSVPIVLDVTREIGMRPKIVVFGKFLDLQSFDDIIESQRSEKIWNFQCEKLSSIDDPAVIMYTSGTTGFPKGAVHSHRSIFGNTQNFCDLGKLDDGKTISLMFSPLAWATGVILMMRAVVLQETRIICHEFDPEKCLELIDRYKINWLYLATSLAKRIQRSPLLNKYDRGSVKYLGIGGTAVSKATQESLISDFPGAKILQAYGTTELGGPTILQNDEMKIGSCGQVARNISIKIIDLSTGRILGPNEPGEALFQSPFMMTGYYHNPKATKNTIDSEGWLHSGDLAYYDESGHIYVGDRKSEFIKYKGNYVLPMTIEQTLEQHPDVAEATVVGKPHNHDDEHPTAFVMRKSNAKVTEEQLKKFVAAKLPDCMKLRGGIRFIDKIPYTPSGKVARQDLKKLLEKYSKL